MQHANPNVKTLLEAQRAIARLVVNQRYGVQDLVAAQDAAMRSWVLALLSSIHHDTLPGAARGLAGRGAITAVAADYTATLDDEWLWCNAVSGDITVTLPQAALADQKLYRVKKTDSSAHTVTIDGYGAETIDGATTAELTDQYESIDLGCDGTDWMIG